MSVSKQNLALKYSGHTVLYLSLFIIPFVLFGNLFEEFAQVFLNSGNSDAAVTFVAALLLAGDPVLPTPSSVVATLLATRIGLIPAAIVNGAALSAACILGYIIGRFGAGAFARHGKRLPQGFVEWVKRHGLVATLLCRPVPVLAEASLIMAGAAKHEPVRLLGWCCVTQMALGAAYAFAGSGWGNGEWNSLAILVGSVGIPVIAALVVFVSFRRDASVSVSEE